jgi:4-alpha-glucanotransferase
LISPDALIEDGLLRASDVAGHSLPAAIVDYEAVISFKLGLLEKAWTNFSAGARSDLRPAYEQFRRDQAHWLDDYALFRALKVRYKGAAYLEWPADLVRRVPHALTQARREEANQIDQVCFAQFTLFGQAERLRAHARAKGVRLIGDLPFFVSSDSSDVWANPELFLLDQEHRPRFVAGVPPDYFAAQGQLWGNPVYDWAALRRAGYRWYLDRLRALLAHVDLIRLDHFRGFGAAWHVPAGAPTAQTGQWLPGPGSDLFDTIEKELGALPFIAEDLGVITPDVSALRDQFHVPKTRVLQFAFDGHRDNPHLPGNYATNTVVYTGTHDNPTTREWYEDLPAAERQNRERRWFERLRLFTFAECLRTNFAPGPHGGTGEIARARALRFLGGDAGRDLLDDGVVGAVAVDPLRVCEVSHSSCNSLLHQTPVKFATGWSWRQPLIHRRNGVRRRSRGFSGFRLGGNLWWGGNTSPYVSV